MDLEQKLKARREKEGPKHRRI
ncbi:uncharacterized protein G2W53_025601 [Senna tora]|uniref:Uncharacterized protein n=1 Tax=Senna tora TaxID=362788 RepID=A0A834WI24_9FABA|nr:uncharacterized protein G2W53_025601 [Senna tora]